VPPMIHRQSTEKFSSIYSIYASQTTTPPGQITAWAGDPLLARVVMGIPANCCPSGVTIRPVSVTNAGTTRPRSVVLLWYRINQRSVLFTGDPPDPRVTKAHL